MDDNQPSLRNENRKHTGRKPRAERAREIREALIKAGLEVVSRHGYAKASVSRIAEASGVAAGTLYSYFDSHQQFLDELVPAEGVRLLEHLGKSARQSTSYLDHEKRTFLAFVAYLKRKPHFLRVLSEAEIAAPQSYAQHMRNIEERYLRALHRAQKNGEIRHQSDRAFRVIAEVLSGARGHILIGFCDRSGARAFRPTPVPGWVAETYVKFVRHGIQHHGSIKPPARHRSARNPSGRPHNTRSVLLSGAARVIHDSGYPRATVQAITQAAGVAVGTFYAHFRSRQELFGELLTDVRSKMLADVREAVVGSRTFAEIECRGFYAFFEHLVRNPWYVRIETEAAVWVPETFMRHFFDIADRYTKALRGAWGRGELQAYEDRELPVLAHIFMAARHYLATRYVVATSMPKRLPSYAADAYVELVCRGLERAAPTA